MSAVTAPDDVAKGSGIYSKAGSLSRERRWAMWWAYASLTLAAIIFLAPPVYMFSRRGCSSPTSCRTRCSSSRSTRSSAGSGC
jgi:hypothetical protein